VHDLSLSRNELRLGALLSWLWMLYALSMVRALHSTSRLLTTNCDPTAGDASCCSTKDFDQKEVIRSVVT